MIRLIALFFWAVPVALAGQELSPGIQVDLHLLRVERQIQSEDYAAALESLDIVLALQARHGMETPVELWFKHAQVALEAGHPQSAVTSVTRYLREAGRQGEHYAPALELLDEAVRQSEEATPPEPTRAAPILAPAPPAPAPAPRDNIGLRAQEQESSSSKVEIGVLVGFTKVSDDDLDVSVVGIPGSALGFGGPLYASIPLGERSAIRAEVSVTSVSIEGESLDVIGSGVYGQVFLLGDSEGPYVLGGGSALVVSIDGDHETELSIGGGFGLLDRAGPGLVFRVEARYARYLEDPMNSYQLLIGFGAPIG